eukprot:symbB.v1.2.034547.t1/scaffold4468.1/size39341/1
MFKKEPMRNFLKTHLPAKAYRCWQMLMHVSCLGSCVGDVMDANGSCGCDAGTGFVAMQNLPESEDDDEEEGDEEIEAPSATERKVSFSQEEGSDSEKMRAMRKGTGFVPMAELPDSDEDEEVDPGADYDDDFEEEDT